MARAFGAATTDNIVNTGAPAVGSAGTLAVWFRPNFNSGIGNAARVWGADGTGTNFDLPGFQHFSDNNIYCGFSNGAGRIVIADTGLFVAGTWAHWVFTWNTSGCALYQNAVQKGTVGAPGGGAVGYVIGNFSNTGTTSANGQIAEYCLWNVVLSALELTALANGVHVMSVRPNQIARYLPLWGLASPEPDLSGNAQNGTVNGTSAAFGPPVTLFTPRNQGFFLPPVILTLMPQIVT